MEITYEFIDGKTFSIFFNKNRDEIFKDDFDFNIEAILSTEEKEKRRNNFEGYGNIKRYYLIAKDKETIVGWSFGIQKSGEDFYMVNSAVFPAYRRKGIYTTLMKHAVERITELGFQRIYSRHKMANNHILIPKLKFGFIITGFDITPIFGNLVELSYYINPKRKELLEIRIGSKKITEEHLPLIE